MIQQITPLLPAPRSTDSTQKGLIRSWLLLLLLLCTCFGAQAYSPGVLGYVNRSVVSDSTISATICANESFVFNGESLQEAGTYTAVFTGSDDQDSTVTLLLEVLPIFESTLNITICSGDAYPFHGELLEESGTYEKVLAAENGCDSTVVLHLNVLNSPATSISAAICAGSSYHFNDDDLTESGEYHAVYEAENGCDSTVTLQLSVVEFFNIQQSATICAGETYTFGDTIVGLSGIYVDSLTALGGCDSTVTLRLTVLPVPETHLEVGICTGSEYHFQDTTLTEAGIYIAQLEAASGCDSLVVLDLTVADIFEVNIDATICAGESYQLGEQTIEEAGDYTLPLVAAGGCDSIITLHLDVLPVSSGTAEFTICAGETLEYEGEKLTEAGEYGFVLTAENGCDSTVTLTLHVLPSPATSLSATICAGDIYEFNGAELDESGTYVRVLEAENGCDSTVTLTLTVLPVPQTEIQVTLCEGATFEYEDESLDAEGNYPFTFTAENGCDSIVTIVVTVLPNSSTEIHASICAGEAYEIDGDELTETGEYEYVLVSENGCDSTVFLILEVLPVQTTHEEAVICDGIPFYYASDTLTESGEYEFVFTSENGCDSVVVLTLNVLPLASTSIEAETCANEPYEYNGESIDQSGTYEFRFDGSNGCDSIVVLHLTVLPVAETTLAVSICTGETYEYDGETLSAGGSYEFVFTAENGCDSVVTVELTLLPLSVSEQELTLCEGATYAFNGEELTESGTYTATLTGENGCDSTAILHLTFVPGFESTLEASICAGESYEFNGENLSESGEYTMTFTSAGGCDSVITLVLTVLPTSESVTNASICAGESYTFNGETYSESGTFTALLTSQNGCDSTAVLHLTVQPVVTTQLSATVCASEPFEFDGELLHESGTYTAVFTGSNGCDSTVVLTLTVLPEHESALEASICSGEAYEFEGEELTETGVYEFVLEGANGCDSIVTVHLTVLPAALSATAAVVCNGASYEFNGEVLTESGTYTFTFPGEAANGCDSVVTLFLNIFPAIPPTNVEASVCPGESYDFYGTPITVAGSYVAHLSSSTGCDSIINLTLSILPNVLAQREASICAGETYSFYGQNLGTAGVYTALAPSATGCDTLVTLTLAVNTVNNTVTLTDGTLTAQATGATFQWFNCNGNVPVPGETGSSFTPTVTGQYSVVITQGNCTDISACQLVQVVGTHEPISDAAWSIQPNPATDRATILLQEPLSGQVRLEVYSLAGQLMLQQKVMSGATQIVLELGEMPAGLLLIRLADESGASTKRLVKTDAP